MTAPSAASSASLTPVAEAERSALIDSLRGFALLGILVVNFWGDTGTRIPKIDAFVSEALDIVVSTSFYPLFSFMFGLGFAVQLLRARDRGSPIARVYVRRMLALLLIGSAHCVLIWDGDILVHYAVFGFVLVAAYRLRDRWLTAFTVAIFATMIFGRQVRPITDRITGSRAAQELTQVAGGVTQVRLDVQAERRELTGADSAGRWQAYVGEVKLRWFTNANRLRGYLTRIPLTSDILAFFLLGLVAGRKKWLQEAERHTKLFARTAAIALPLIIAADITIYKWDDRPPMLNQFLYQIQDYGTTLFYISVFALAFGSMPRIAAKLRVFAAPGKIGLTNYLMQSVVMTIPFAQYGFRITEPTTTAWLALNVVFFFAVQIPFSRWWSARYLFGPLEWVWRSVTYGERQPLRRV